jgi:hypothetical protein
MTIRDSKGKPTIRDSKGRARKKAKRPADVNQLAHMLGNQSTAEAEPEPTQAEISRVMAVLGSRGGKIGGKRRLETLTQDRRSQIAYKAAQARWGKKARKP